MLETFLTYIEWLDHHRVWARICCYNYFEKTYNLFPKLKQVVIISLKCTKYFRIYHIRWRLGDRDYLVFCIITVTPKWPRWRLKSPASLLLTQPFMYAQIKENINALRHWPWWREFTGEFPAQRASNAENVSIWWRHHVKALYQVYAADTCVIGYYILKSWISISIT